MEYAQTITERTVRQMRGELDQMEALARQELKFRKTKSLGLLRMQLVDECRRRLLMTSATPDRSELLDDGRKLKCLA